jgi:E3 ubiquitin-protein ligase RFWD2
MNFWVRLSDFSKVFDYNTTISQDVVDIHYPHSEMVCNSKISCVSWNSYMKGWLASSDYEGSVLVWDAFVGTKLQSFQEHEKRCWSVDFNHVDAKLIASGSDDCKVKLWSTNMSHSVKSIESKANVCCVEFSPTSRCVGLV